MGRFTLPSVPAIELCGSPVDFGLFAVRESLKQIVQKPGKKGMEGKLFRRRFNHFNEEVCVLQSVYEGDAGFAGHSSDKIRRKRTGYRRFYEGLLLFRG